MRRIDFKPEKLLVRCYALSNWVDCEECGKVYHCIFYTSEPKSRGRLFSQVDCPFCGSVAGDECIGTYPTEYSYDAGAFCYYFMPMLPGQSQVVNSLMSLWDGLPQPKSVYIGMCYEELQKAG